MTMVLAVGTSMPVSMMVVHSSTLCALGYEVAHHPLELALAASGRGPPRCAPRAAALRASARRFSMVSTSLCRK
jgi:hypothetical protein